MRWAICLSLASFFIGIMTVGIIHAWYGSLAPCEILKQDYLQRKGEERNLSERLSYSDQMTVAFVFQRFIANYVAGVSSWQCVKDLVKIKLNKFDNFREKALSESLGNPIPEFSLTGIPGLADGGLSSDELLRDGKLTVANFFASWCVPCRAEAPFLQRLSALPKIRLVGINYMDKPDAAVAWLSKYGDPYSRIGMDQTGERSLEWKLTGLPETFIIDGSGVIIYRHPGAIDQAVLDNVIFPLLQRLKERSTSSIGYLSRHDSGLRRLVAAF